MGLGLFELMKLNSGFNECNMEANYLLCLLKIDENGDNIFYLFFAS